MKRSKTMLVLLVALLVISLTLTACGNGGTTDNSNDSKTGDTASPSTSDSAGDKEGKGSFSYLLAAKFDNWLKELKWYPYALEATNTEVEIIAETTSDYTSAVDQRLLSNTFPDSGIVTNAQSKVYGEEGAFVDLTPYIDQYAPNIKAFIDNNPDYKSFITADNGAIYGIAQEDAQYANLFFYRTDMFEKAGINSVPADVDEFTNTLRTLRDYYGASNPNYYPFDGRDEIIRLQGLFNCFASIENGVVSGLIGPKPSTSYDLKSEGYKEMIEWYKLLEEEKLVSPEWASGASTEERWQSNMLTGLTTVGLDFFTRGAWFMNNGGPENDPDYNIEIMPYLKDKNGNTMHMYVNNRFRNDRSIVVNAKSEDKVEDVLSFIDFFFSEEGQTLVHWGVEGDSYVVENGQKKFIADYDVEESAPSGEARWSFLNDRLTFPKPIDNNAFYQWNSDIVVEGALENFTENNLRSLPNLKYSADQAKEYDTLYASVNVAVQAGATKFITGERDMNEWDNFLKEMDDMGYSRLVEIQQEAYDNMMK